MKIVVKDYDLKCFKDKEEVTLNEIIDILQEYEETIDDLKHEELILINTISEEREIRKDFYVRKSPYEIYGVSERDF